LFDCECDTVPRRSRIPQPNRLAAAQPKFYYGNSEDYRFQLGVGYEYVRFHSAPFDANLNGFHTSLTYYLNDWFGLEGNTVAAFGTKISGATSKYFLYTGGGRIAWRDARRRYEPWMHVLVGGLHMIRKRLRAVRTDLRFKPVAVWIFDSTAACPSASKATTFARSCITVAEQFPVWRRRSHTLLVLRP